jgi:hypothetical protein
MTEELRRLECSLSRLYSVVVSTLSLLYARIAGSGSLEPPISSALTRPADYYIKRLRALLYHSPVRLALVDVLQASDPETANALLYMTDNEFADWITNCLEENPWLLLSSRVIHILAHLIH